MEQCVPGNLTEAARAMIGREVEPFLPDRIFDAHAHLFSHDHYPDGTLPEGLKNTPARLGLAEYFDCMEWIYPGGRTRGGLFFGLAFLGDRQANNEFVAAELTVTLHMVRDRTLADALNQATIPRYCETYPDLRLILAHAAHGFNPWHMIEGIESLRGLENIWFDTSAVTEAGAFKAIIETIGQRRLLYGSDFHVSHTQGRCVAIGDSFHWFHPEDMDLQERHTVLDPGLVGIESLRSLRLACSRLNRAIPKSRISFGTMPPSSLAAHAR